MALSFLPFEAVKAAVLADDAQKADYLVPLNELEVEVGEDGKWGCLCPFGTFSFSPLAQEQVCQKLGLPLSYLRRCPPWLQRQNLSFWLSKRQQKGGKVLLRTKGEWVRAFLSPSFSPFDHRDLLQVLESLPSVGETLLPFQFALTEKALHLSLLNPEPVEVAWDGRRERLHLGVYLRNSEVGFAKVALSACLHRHACGNLFVSETVFAKVHLGLDKGAIRERLSSALKRALTLTAPKIAQALQASLSVLLSPKAKERAFAHAAKLAGQKALKALLATEYEREKEQSGSGETLFTLTQALTRVASRLPDAETKFVLCRWATSLLPQGNGEDLLWQGGEGRWSFPPSG